MRNNRVRGVRGVPGRLVWLVIVGAMSASAAAAQPRPSATRTAPEIASDRPGFNAPAAVVPRGAVHLELGWAHSGGDDEHSDAPEPLLRLGVHRRLEVQVGGLGFETWCTTGCAWVASDLTVGARHVLPVEPLGTTLAITGAVLLPIGHHAVTAGHAEPTTILHADRDVGGGFNLSYNYVWTREHGEDDRGHARHGHGFSVERESGAWTPYVGFARRPMRDDDGVPWVGQVGTTWRLAADVQLDVTVDIGLTRAEPSWGVSGGVVVRRRPVDRIGRAQ
ncbi:MAG TPA: hypothetical protein VMF13_13120 [Luteitalea sp.]|nr:hypothetical protein [Luteitalea sp.]